ncbi:hypothetical protein [Patulibacter minatonensis]|uniref:hypothetical protein n=1 Tax=Patulibacter minatonensis TaxID=298163 RepID=UPI00047BE19B|nr:hypothetical protein [Patulibacter minatonensis]
MTDERPDEPDEHGDPRSEDGGNEDPFAFPDDSRPSGGGPGDHRARDAGGTADEDPFAFPGSEGPADDRPDAAPGATDGPAVAPVGADDTTAAAPSRRRRRGRPSAARRSDDEAARIRAAAEAASARAQAVGVRWLAVAGIVLVLLVGVTTLIGGRDGGPTGGDVAAGEQLPDFAAPLATAPKLDRDDVNVAQKDGQGEAGKYAACSIRNPSVVTSCALLDRGPLVLVLFSRGVQQCVDAVDLLDRERRRFPTLQTLAVATLGQHDATAETAASRRWTLPVAYDRDRGFSALLGAPACPLVLFVRRDGTVEKRIIGRLSTDALVRAMRGLARSAAPPTTTVDATPPGR